MQTRASVLTTLGLVVFGICIVGCGDDNKPTGRCSVQGVKGTAPSLAGIWLVQDTSYVCGVLAQRRGRGERIDTFGVDGPVFDEVYYRKVWERFAEDLRIGETPLLFDCVNGNVSDSDIKILGFGAMGGSNECHPPVDFNTLASPNASSWILYNAVRYAIAGDSCGLPVVGDTVSFCYTYKSVYTKLEDLPD